MGSPELGITRREFFKKVGTIAAVGTAATAAGLIVENAVDKEKDGIIRVDEGNFFPFYENHLIGISPENFPQNIDALFRENFDNLSSIKSAFSNSPQLAKDFLALENNNTDADEIMSNLFRRKIPLVFGDIQLSNSLATDMDLSSGVNIVEIAAGIFAAAKIPLTRRKVLKLALGAIALHGLSNLAIFPTYSNFIAPPDWARKISRINGITSHLHPEQPMTFLRNAVMADKLLLTGKYLKNKLGRQPNIVFFVGAGHSGIEDFLQAGQEACRQAIMLYPKIYLKKVIEKNGGSEDFSSALLAYPHATGKKQFVFTFIKITDQKLKEKLSTS